MKKSVSLILSFSSDVFEQSPVPRQDDSLASSKSRNHICMDKKQATHKIGKKRRDSGGRWRHTLTMKTHDSSGLVSICFGTQTKE